MKLRNKSWIIVFEIPKMPNPTCKGLLYKTESGVIWTAVRFSLYSNVLSNFRRTIKVSAAFYVPINFPGQNLKQLWYVCLYVPFQKVFSKQIFAGFVSWVFTSIHIKINWVLFIKFMNWNVYFFLLFKIKINLKWLPFGRRMFSEQKGKPYKFSGYSKSTSNT